MKGPSWTPSRRGSVCSALRCLVPLLWFWLAVDEASAYILLNGSPPVPLFFKQRPLEAPVTPHLFTLPWGPQLVASRGGTSEELLLGPSRLLRPSRLLAAQVEDTGDSVEEEDGNESSYRFEGGSVEYEEPHAAVPNRDFSWGTRKQSYARVRLFEGTGCLSINKRAGEEYLQGNEFWLLNCRAPLIEAKVEQKYDIEAEAKGGGLGGQSGAIMLAVARELCRQQPHLRPVLKRAGFLTVDSRRVERKKFGLKKARKRPQYSKR